MTMWHNRNSNSKDNQMFCVFIRQLNELHTFALWDDRVAFTETLRNNPDILSHTTWAQPIDCPLLPLYSKSRIVAHN